MTAEQQDQRCDGKKMGEYNPLRCVREKDHDGEHNYVVDGEYPWNQKKDKRR